MPVEERFWLKVNKTDNCWNWIAGRKRVGYGSFTVNSSRRGVLAHRYSYEMAYGEIPKGLYVCHACDNYLCVRPTHLFLGTQKVNMSDCVDKGRIARGEKIPKAKMTAVQVREIRQKYPYMTLRTLAIEYGMSREGIRDIVNKITWKHI